MGLSWCVTINEWNKEPQQVAGGWFKARQHLLDMFILRRESHTYILYVEGKCLVQTFSRKLVQWQEFVSSLILFLLQYRICRDCLINDILSGFCPCCAPTSLRFNEQRNSVTQFIQDRTDELLKTAKIEEVIYIIIGSLGIFNSILSLFLSAMS